MGVKTNVNSWNIQGTETVLLALDTSTLIKAENENILKRKINRIMKENYKLDFMQIV
jgi:hypothetical protein